jgi:zinc transport system ATP-binding protein
MAGAQIIIRELSFSYDKHHHVLENINLTINRNDIITVIGPNGGGKTTLLRLIIGLLEPDSGTIFINGSNTSAYRGRIGYVPQHSQFDRHFPITVLDVVLSGLIKPFGFYTKNDKLKAEEALKNVGLYSERNKSFSNLSGGQSQRMLIARALVSEKEILLLDEPTSNIDPAAGRHLNSLIEELSKEMTIILVTHDTGFVTNITDRVLCINKTIVEHPIDENFSEIIASSYGWQSKIVRHETKLTEKSRDGGIKID